MSHLIALKYFSAKEVGGIIELAGKIKNDPAQYQDSLRGKHIGLLFEKPSLRTKAAFYVGAGQLGAGAVYFSPEEVKIGKREKIGDVSRTMSQFLDLVVLRTFSHETILEFAKFSSLPIVNGLSDLFHPSQALADILTIYETKGTLDNLKVAYAGDSNNVCNSLIYAFSILGGKLHIASPKGYAPSKKILVESGGFASKSSAKVIVTGSITEAVEDADVIYTDVWSSMGMESEKIKRKKVFKNFQINDKILKLAKKDCIVMHCLPAYRGQEITDSVIDGPNSVVFQQAQNRMHTAKAILVYILKGV
ncbi:MAG: ornithine carbamoyltransferase [Candidatus Omnitrophota bacterium]